MLSLILIRHGETDWNNQQRIQGQRDLPLNEIGRQQARDLQPVLAPAFAGSTVKVCVISSDLQRTLQTAQIAINGLADIETDTRLRELDYGEWEGLDRPALESRCPSEAAHWFRGDDFDFKPHGGESLRELHQRMLGFHQAVILPLIQPQPQRAIVFTHGAALMAYLNVILQARARFATDNGALSEIILRPCALPEVAQFNQLPQHVPVLHPLFR
jgi:2,3-bisphosphoglycerate-dependent phosphoglycerate mutase